MSDSVQNPITTTEPTSRPVGGTEYSWCKAVPGGTGTTVLAILLTKPPDLSNLRTAIHSLQYTHPILLSKLHYSSTTNTFSFITPPSAHLQITTFDASSTAHILQSTVVAATPFQTILEHELNKPIRHNADNSSDHDVDVMFTSVYSLGEDGKWVVAIRCHTAACDRTSAVTLLRKLLDLFSGERTDTEIGEKREVGLGIEECIPNGKSNKPFWTRGVDMLGYSLNSLRLSNLEFREVGMPKFSQVVRLKINSSHTDQILTGCKSSGVKLCGVLAAAGIIAALSSKGLPDHQWEKYAVATLLDCRSILDPALYNQNFGFYHSAIINTHDIKNGQELWDLAKRCYTAFANAKNSNKHFSDMADLNFLMCKAIENPGLTPSSSLRTSLISVFEDPVIDHCNQVHQEMGLEDFIGCASVHGVGPSIAIFDTIRDGCLDCACVCPAPLHSREQMEEFVEDMRRILVGGCNSGETES